MTEELDVVRFIRLQKQARFAVKTIFSRFQLWLLQNQKMFVINHNPETTSSDADSSDDPVISRRVLRQEEDLLTFKKLAHNALNRQKYTDQYLNNTLDKEDENEVVDNEPDLFRTLTR